METKEKKDNNEAFLKRYDTVFSFLGLEIIALTLFGLGGTTGMVIFNVAGFFVGLYLIPYIKNNNPNMDKKKTILSVVPVLCLALFLSFSPFWFNYYGGLGFSSLVMNTISGLGILGLFLLGLGLKNIPVLKKDILYLVILGALGLIVLLTGFYSLVRYGFFYSARFNGMVYYYDGIMYTVYNETKALVGFSFTEVHMRFGKIAAFALASSGVGLFFLNPKTESRRFYTLLGFAGLGLVDLAIVPYKLGLVLLACVYFAGFVAWLFHLLGKKNPKALSLIKKIAFYGLIFLAASGVLLLVLDTRYGFLQRAGIPYISASLSSKTAYFGSMENAIAYALFEKGDVELHRFSLTSFLFGYSGKTVSGSMIVPVTHTFEFNVVWQNGFLGLAALLSVIFMTMRNGSRFLEESKEEAGPSFAILGILFGLFLYLSVCSEELPLVHGSGLYASTRLPLFYGAMFLIGLTTPILNKKEVAHE